LISDVCTPCFLRQSTSAVAALGFTVAVAPLDCPPAEEPELAAGAVVAAAVELVDDPELPHAASTRIARSAQANEIG
jgi:hypothetical protein